MPQAPVPTYRVQYEPSRGSWTLTGPVGAKGFLRYGTGRDAVSYARWDARNTGGKVEVFDQQGQLPWFAAVGSLLLDGLKKVWKKLKKYPFRLIQALFRH
jgi:hypothetical protein